MAYGTTVRRSLSVKRMIEYGANHQIYKPIDKMSVEDLEPTDNEALKARLRTPSSELDLTYFQRSKIAELRLDTIGDVLGADEGVFKQAHYVGPVRARHIRNAAVAAVLEYLSG